MLDVSCTGGSKCCKNMESGRTAVGSNAKSLQTKCTRLLLEGKLVIALMYGSETKV